MPPSSISPPRADRVALLLVQAGAIAVVLASLPYKAFDLDRYFVPKELVAPHRRGRRGILLPHAARTTLTGAH